MQGDTAGAAAEVLKNIKGSAEFTNMNRIQQDALAKSLGMSSDELANSLVKQEKLAKLGYPEVGDKNTVLHKAKSFVSCAVGRIDR